MTTHTWNFIVFLLGALGISAYMLTIGFFLGGRSSARSKNIQFESGMNPVGTARVRLAVKFYLVAMFFVIFDVEALYLYVWATGIRELGWTGLIETSIFSGILLVSLFYLVRIGAIDWMQEHSFRLKQANKINAYPHHLNTPARNNNGLHLNQGDNR